MNEIEDFYGEDQFNPDYLVDELQMYYEPERGKRWAMLRHPLVYQVPFMSWKLANKSLEYKGERLAQYIKEGKIPGALWLYERPYRMTMLQEFVKRGLVSNTSLRELLPEVWTDTEVPSQYGYRSLVSLFRKAGFLTDIPGLRLPIECEVYRGCFARHKRGISWTLDLKRAQWFAMRYTKGNGRVYKATIPPEGVLGVFNSRGEQEVVVDPKFLKDFTEITGMQ